MPDQTSDAQVPQVDLTAVNAVQSLFDRDTRDPWARQVAAEFVDFVLWNDRLRYPVLLMADDRARSEGVVTPALLADLNRRESGLASPDVRLLDERPVLDEHLLVPAWRAFDAFVTNNRQQVRGFLDLHSGESIKDQIRSRLGDDSPYIFDVHVLAARGETERFERKVRLSEAETFYLFDLVLKYLLYAEQARGQYYLSHPVRERLNYRCLDSALSVTDAEPRTVPFRLGPHLVAAAVSRDQDWFTSRLHEARAFVRERNMTDLSVPGAVSRDELRQLAERLGLPPSVRHFQAVDRVAAISSAAAGVAGSLATASPVPAIVGAALSVVTKVWSGGMPAAASRARWLQWMLEWPIEQEAEAGR